jgi:hypothetical protein
MNPAEERIRIRLDDFSGEFTPLADAALRYLRYCSAMDIDGTALIGHMPWKAPLAYAFRLFPPAKKSWFSRYAKVRGIQIPAKLRPLLSTVNGCFAFGLSLFGMPLSMIKEPPLLDRSNLQPHDLSLANENQGWKYGFRGAEDGFHFGGRHYSYTENAGFFLFGGSQIVSLLKDGSVVGKWREFSSFLRDELAAAEAFECSKIPAEWWH